MQQDEWSTPSVPRSYTHKDLTTNTVIPPAIPIRKMAFVYEVLAQLDMLMAAVPHPVSNALE